MIPARTFLLSMAVLIPALGSAASVTVEPDRILRLGEDSVIKVKILNAENIYGAQLVIAYDPGVLQVVDADPGKPGLQIQLGDVVPADGGAEVQHQVIPREGRIAWTKSRVWPAEPFSGAGILVQVPVRVVAEGNTGLSFVTLKLGTPDGKVVTPPATFSSAALETGIALDQGSRTIHTNWLLSTVGACLFLVSFWLIRRHKAPRRSGLRSARNLPCNVKERAGEGSVGQKVEVSSSG